MGSGSSRRAARKDRSRGGGRRHDCGNHPPLAQIQIRDALHVISRGAPLAAPAAPHPPGRSRASRPNPSVVSVIALFPFGLTKPLRYLQQEDIWQTRFLAPADLADGVYTVRLILRDKEGRVVRENKTFLVSSQPPLVRVTLSQSRARPGETILLSVRASQTTRLITASLYGAEPVSLRWSEEAKSSTGSLVVPTSFPAGRYTIHVTAEDVAHNVSHQEVPLDVLP